MSRTEALPAVSAWNAQLVRFTLFVKQPFDVLGLWESYVGAPPSVDESRPREAVRRQAGPFGDAFLEILTSPGRLDWFLAPPPATDANTLSTQIGPVDQSFELFDRALVSWLSQPPAVEAIRVAVGLTAMLPVPTRIAAYEVLQQLLQSVQVDPENSSEFLYQINRPKPGRSLGGVKLNRIMRWSAMVNRSLVLSAPPFEVSVPQTTGEQHFVRVEFDNSTPLADPTGPALEPSQLVPIYRELQEMALENIRRGELA